MIGPTPTTLGVGIGIAVAPDDGTERDELVRRADLALYRAKAEGQSTIRFFEPDMDAHVERRMRIERELRNALAAGAIVPHYQPLVSLAETASSALRRWPVGRARNWVSCRRRYSSRCRRMRPYQRAWGSAVEAGLP